MAKKGERTGDRVKFSGNWEDLAARMVKPAPKPAPRATKKRRSRKAK